MKKQMKKWTVILFGLIVVSTATTVTSCKKGKNDPAISLKSRKARLSGDWELTGYSSTEKYYDGGDVREEVHLEGTTLTKKTYLNETLVNTETQEFSEKLSFTKDGKYTMTHINQTTEGNWAFIGKNKDAGLKNKEAVLLSDTKVTYSDGTSQSWETNSMFADGILTLDRLSNKEMFVKSSTTSTFNDKPDTFEAVFSYAKQ